MWQIIETIPTIIFLVFFYIFMVDIENYYNAFDVAGSGTTTLTTFYVVTYSTVIKTYWANFLVKQEEWLIAIYVFLYNLATIYLNPIQWVQWIIEFFNTIYA